MTISLSPEEKKLFAYLRINSREKLTKLSRKTHIPVSTIHEKLKHYKGRFIRKYTLILNPDRLGYPIKTHSVIKVHHSSKEELGRYLRKHGNVNNLYKINNGYNFVFDAYFRSMNESEMFFEELEKEHKIKKRETHYILDEIKREGFMGKEIGAHDANK